MTPFLQKHHPQVIHKLSNRLKDIAGKRIVIDGTLITQRLHYAPSPHQFRHVLGWYHLAREMNENGVSAVCIFDGQKRSKAKAEESRRREETRRLDLSRRQVEILRAKRLQTLKTLVSGVRSLDDTGKIRIAEALSKLSPSDGGGIVGAADGLSHVGERLRALSEAISPSAESPSEEVPLSTEPANKKLAEDAPAKQLSLSSGEEVLPPAHFPSKELSPLTRPLDKEIPLSTQSPSRETTRLEPLCQKIATDDEGVLEKPEPSVEQLTQPQGSGFMDIRHPELHIPVSSISLAEDLRATLISSYRDFKSSISNVAPLPLPQSRLKQSVPVVPSITEPDAHEEEDAVLSKRQYELTLEEGRVWDELALATTPNSPPTPSTPPLPASVDGDVANRTAPVPSDSNFPIESTPQGVTTPTIPTPELASMPPGPALDQLMLRAAEKRLDALRVRSEVVAESYQRRVNTPTRNTYLESMEILEAMGVLCYEIEGEHEGEALASSLVLKGLADYVVSEDSDVLVYEAPLIRNMSSRGEPLVLIHGSDVRRALDLPKDAYIDFMLLLGTDFSKRIKNVGPQRAYKFIQDYGTIEGIITCQSKYQPTTPCAEYLAQIQAARAIFHSPTPIPDRLAVSMMPTEFGFGLVDQAKVNVIMERCGLGKVLMMGAYWDYEAALAGNYFDDNPTTYL